MIGVIKVILKRPVYLAMLILCYLSDFFRYSINASVVFLSDSHYKLGFLIRKDNHRIEKGLALPQPRPWFGAPVLSRLLSNLQKYLKTGKADQRLLDETAAVLDCYIGYFGRQNPPPSNIKSKLDELARLLGNRNSFEAGIVNIDKEKIDEAISIDYARFFNSRFSVRQFSGGVVAKEVIERSVQLATKTPSVCNRCAWKVYNVETPEMVRKVLACQNGNAGFGDRCGNVLVVAMDLRAFEGPGERYQPYVDGGLFAMSLALALHSNGVASCFLNWSAHVLQDNKLRSVLNMPAHEVVVTLLGVGLYPDEFAVAISPRPSALEVACNV